jgi:hypothetical protein
MQLNSRKMWYGLCVGPKEKKEEASFAFIKQPGKPKDCRGSP